MEGADPWRGPCTVHKGNMKDLWALPQRSQQVLLGCVLIGGQGCHSAEPAVPDWMCSDWRAGLYWSGFRNITGTERERAANEENNGSHNMRRLKMRPI